MPRDEKTRRPATNVINAILAAHWAMEEHALHTMLEIAGRENLDPEAVAAKLGRPLDNTHAVTIRDGVASIPVTGPLFRYADMFTAISGATTYEQIATDLTAALDNRGVRAILLEIDSPGGDVNGLSQLADLVASARGTKPVVAFISGTGASAAYWLASAAEAVVVSDTAIVGSIGVRASYRDTKAIDQARGIKTIEIVSSQSPNKRMDPGEDTGRAALQQVMDDLAQVFVETVAVNRDVTPESVLADFGQGGVFVGQAAVDAGLADAVGTYESTFAALRDRGEAAVAAWRGATTSARSRAELPAAPAAAASLTSEILMDTKDTPSPAATAGVTTTGAETPTPSATIVAIDEAQVRKQERERIAAIRTLGAGADQALVTRAIDEGLSAEAASRLFLEAQHQGAAARLSQLRADEAAAPAPGAAPGTESISVRQAAKAATSAYYALSAPKTAAK
ncbi:MAG TPA: S49 family peptidase [Candidatus Limnocylindria bacterium]